MDFIDQLHALATQAGKQLDHLKTEEATKTALVMPFLQVLGYNVFNPTEVVPEFTADVGVKRGEKVDYAVLKDGQAIMLVECKSAGTDLDEVHASQLFRYFSVTHARIGVLTNGIIYRFFSDLEAPNKMDDRPFLEIDILSLDDTVLPELKKLTKPQFDQDAIIETAGELKYTKEIKRILAEQLTSPSDAFVRLLAAEVYSGRLMKSVREQFAVIVRRAFNQFVNDQINARLTSALRQSSEPESEEHQQEARVLTTEEEIEGYHIVRAILREVVPADRIFPRDVKSYFSILLDDSNRQPLCRLRFNATRKYVGLFDKGDKMEERVPIEALEDIYKLATRLCATPAFYDESLAVPSAGERA